MYHRITKDGRFRPFGTHKDVEILKTQGGIYREN